MKRQHPTWKNYLKSSLSIYYPRQSSFYNNTTFFDAGFKNYQEIRSYISNYGFEGEIVNQKIGALSGGEKNMLQLAKVSAQKANILLLDEPTSHLDTYSQIALEKAIENYKGAILMISIQL